MKYRPEVDGLRALAVVPVIFFHAGFAPFAGGFVGVDVFFVISGYLITSILLREAETDSFSLIRFYERRARRILPALVLVVLACIPVAWMTMEPVEMKDFAQSIVAVSVFLSNVFFWLESGYFAAASELKPLLHTWSLAVEEQFYILFPLLLVLVYSLARGALVPIMVLLALASLALAEWGWRNAASANFFLAPSRAWELLAGALCAVALRREIAGNSWLSGLGIAMIVASIMLFDEQTPFPSLYTLLPVLGTVLIIVFADQASLTGRLLSLRVFVGLGLVSYSAYLWHQPLFAFARLILERAPPVPLYWALIVATFALAYLSWRYVEAPFRASSGPRAMSQRTIFSSAAAVSVALFAFGLWGQMSDGWRDAYLARLSEGERAMFLQVERVQRDHVANAKGRFDDGACVFDTSVLDAAVQERLKACAQRFGPGMLVLGDSHAIDLYGAVIETERADRPFIAGIVSGGCRAHGADAACSYDALARFIAAEPDVFELVTYTQAGFYLLHGQGYQTGRRSMFAELEPGAPTPPYEPHPPRLAEVKTYLETLARHVPVVWLTPRLEPHISMDQIKRQGCAHPYQLRPGLRKVFDGLEAAIAAALSGSEVKVLLQSDLLGLSMPQDLLSCDALYWSDGDHFSNAGEKRFGQRLQVLKAAHAAHGL